MDMDAVPICRPLIHLADAIGGERRRWFVIHDPRVKAAEWLPGKWPGRD
jgi:hypothetical protein